MAEKPDPAEITAAQQHRSPSPDTKSIEAALNDLDFPTDQDSVVTHAESKGAGEEVVRALRRLPIATYDNVGDIIRSVPRA